MKYHVELAAIHPLEMSPERIEALQKEFINAVGEIGDLRQQIEKERRASGETLAAANTENEILRREVAELRRGEGKAE